MPDADRLDTLRRRAARALGERKVADVVTTIRAIIGPGAVPDSEPLAQAALDKLRSGEVPGVDELTALEIVIRLLRPVVLTRNGTIDDLPEKPGHQLYSQEQKDEWSAFRTKVEPVLDSIGRVETADGKHVGTGFLVGADLLATNRHVLGALTFGAEVLQPGSARVVFRQEAGAANRPGDIVPIEAVVSVHPTLDLALLRVARQARTPIALDGGRMSEGNNVVVIGYPAQDKANNPLFLAGVFQGRFGVRRAAVGEVLDGIRLPAFFHDCSTTQGNSGSPIFSLDSGKVKGIHRAGYFMYRNEAIDGTSLADFARPELT